VGKDSVADVLGFDIGGANTKAVLVRAENGRLKDIKLDIEYFPVWKEPQKLSKVLLKLKQRLIAERLDGLGVTMTAELSDAYQTKTEGVHSVIAGVKESFPDTPIHVLNTDGELESTDKAELVPLGVAAANWAATGWLVAQRIDNCVIADVGSTSTSIIPVASGKVAAQGKTDLDKLICGELVYTGGLRTNVAAIIQSIPVRGGIANVASEMFALSADVHLILGHITEVQYTSETADGRGKTLPEAYARLARVVCADTDMLTNQEIFEMAKYIYHKQVLQVAQGLAKVYSHVKKQSKNEVSIVVTGLSKDFIARKAAEKIGADSIIDLATFLPKEASMATPAFAVALMIANKIEGETIGWMQ